MSRKEIIATEQAPKAIGPYSQAVSANGFLYTSGQIGLNPATGEMVGDTIEAQTERVMENLKAVLAQASVGFDRVVKTTCFLADMNDFAAFNAIYGAYFTDNAPARSCVAAAALPKGAKVEVECIAVL